MKHRLFPDKEFLLVCLAASLGSLFLLIFIPPTWNYADSIVYLLDTPGPSVMLHYPPLYWFFLKVCNYLALQASDPFNTHIWNQVFFSSAVSKNGLYTAIIIQHLFLAGALVYIAWGWGKNFWTRLIIIITLLANPALLFFNHGFYSEGLWISFVIFQLGSSFIIATQSEIRAHHYIIYILSIFFGILTRHIGIILAPFLPWLIIASRFSRIKEPMNFWFKKFSFSILATVFALTLNSLVLKKIYDSFGIEKRSTVGHPSMSRIIDFPWEKLNRSEKIQIIQNMQNRTDDPLVYEAIPLAIPLDKKPSEEMQNEIYSLILKKIKTLGGKSLSPSQINQEMILAFQDRVLNKICRLFLTSGNRHLLQIMAQDMDKYYTASLLDSTHDILDTSVRSLDLYNHYEPREKTLLLPISKMIRSENTSKYQTLMHILQSWPLSLWGKVKNYHLILFLMVSVIICYFKQWIEEGTVLFILSCILFLISYVTIMSIISIFLFRYTLLNSVLIHLPLALFIVQNLTRSRPDQFSKKG